MPRAGAVRRDAAPGTGERRKVAASMSSAGTTNTCSMRGIVPARARRRRPHRPARAPAGHRDPTFAQRLRQVRAPARSPGVVRHEHQPGGVPRAQGDAGVAGERAQPGVGPADHQAAAVAAEAVGGDPAAMGHAHQRRRARARPARGWARRRAARSGRSRRHPARRGGRTNRLGGGVGRWSMAARRWRRTSEAVAHVRKAAFAAEWRGVGTPRGCGGGRARTLPPCALGGAAGEKSAGSNKAQFVRCGK